MTNTNRHPSFELCWATGYTEGPFRTHDDAVEAFLERHSSGVAGHDGDLTSGGSRTLCWENAEDAEGDDGARAVASVRELEDSPVTVRLAPSEARLLVSRFAPEDERLAAAIIEEIETLTSLGYSEDAVARAAELALRFGSVEMTPRRAPPPAVPEKSP